MFIEPKYQTGMAVKRNVYYFRLKPPFSVCLLAQLLAKLFSKGASLLLLHQVFTSFFIIRRHLKQDD